MVAVALFYVNANSSHSEINKKKKIVNAAMLSMQTVTRVYRLHARTVIRSVPYANALKVRNLCGALAHR